MKGLGDKTTLCRSFIEDNSVLLGYYAASSDNSLPTVRDKLSVPTSRIKNHLSFEDQTDRLSRNVGSGNTARCVIAQKSAVLTYFEAEA